MTSAETPSPDAPIQDAETAIAAGLERALQHQAAGRLDEAQTMLDALAETHGTPPKVLHYQGMNQILRGDHEDGLTKIRAVLEITPQDVLVLSDLGSVLAQGGQMDEALEHFQSAVDLAPNFSLAQSNLGAALVVKDRHAEAIPHLEKAIELDPRLLDAHTNLGTALNQRQQFDRAIDVLFKALAIDPQSVTAHIGLAGALFRRERHEAAEHHARRALELAPGAEEARLHLGNILAASGRIDAAAEELLNVARLPGLQVMGLSRLVHLRRTVPDSPELKILQALLERADELIEPQRATLHFAAGKAFDDLGDYSAAIGQLAEANRLNREQHPYDRQINIERAERLRDFASPALLERVSGQGPSNLAPIFICGMPRSGTTLMDQMFSRHPQVQAGGELAATMVALRKNGRIRQALEESIPDSDLTADDFAQLGEAYSAFLHGEGLRSEYVSDKMPSNYLYAGLLAAALPRAKFLIMRRHPMDCLLSNYLQHFGQNQPFSSDFGDLAAVYRQFDLMAKHWLRVLPGRVREVHYEDVVADAGTTMRGVVEFVGLDWADEMLDHTASSRQVNTASVAQVREPIYGSSVAKWRRYGPLLGGLAEELRDFLTEEELAACGL